MTLPRIAALRTRLHEQKLDALLVSSLPNIRYVSGFSGSHALCIVTRAEQFFLTDGRYIQQSREEVRGFRAFISSGSLFEVVRKKKLLSGLRRVGYESQTMTVAEFANLKKEFPRHEFIPASSIVPSLRSVKDPHELELIERAVGISDKVFQKILGIIKPGTTEREIAAELTYWHARYGAEADAFEPIVASGLRGALPHGRASDKKIRRGELVTLDFGCRVNGYHSDITRTVALGKPTSRLRAIYEAVEEAEALGVEAVRVGVATKQVDHQVRSFLNTKKFARYFSHSLGHGLGLEVHEYPRLSRLSNETLSAGNVVTVEPGVYIPGVGGVRIEDDVLVTDRGARVLNRSPKDLIIL